MMNWKDLLGKLQPSQLEPLEVRTAVLRAIEDLVQPLGDGRRGLLHNRITVRLLSADESRRQILRAVLENEPGLPAAAVSRLEASGCFAPADLTVEISESPAPEGAAVPDFELSAKIEGGAQAALAGGLAQAAAPAPPAERRPRPRAKLVLLEGGPKEWEIGTDVCAIGRVQEVRGKDHRPVRRNQVWFGEDAASVSRQHASIRYFPESGEFRLFDDRSARGTRLFTGGEPVEVPPGRSRGELLHPGDEIYFGSVGVRFEVAE